MAEQVVQADSLLAKVTDLETDARRLGKAAEKAGDARTALAAVRELCRIVELLGRLRGELTTSATLAIVIAKLPDETFEEEWLRRYPGTAPLPREATQELGSLVEQLRRLGEGARQAEAEWRAHLPPEASEAIRHAERLTGHPLRRDPDEGSEPLSDLDNPNGAEQAVVAGRSAA
jgi:hypothetical protein